MIIFESCTTFHKPLALLFIYRPLIYSNEIEVLTINVKKSGIYFFNLGDCTIFAIRKRE